MIACWTALPRAHVADHHVFVRIMHVPSASFNVGFGPRRVLRTHFPRSRTNRRSSAKAPTPVQICTTGFANSERKRIEVRVCLLPTPETEGLLCRF